MLFLSVVHINFSTEEPLGLLLFAVRFPVVHILVDQTYVNTVSRSDDPMVTFHPRLSEGILDLVLCPVENRPLSSQPILPPGACSTLKTGLLTLCYTGLSAPKILLERFIKRERGWMKGIIMSL